jgi:hypothetical protein
MNYPLFCNAYTAKQLTSLSVFAQQSRIIYCGTFLYEQLKTNKCCIVWCFPRFMHKFLSPTEFVERLSRCFRAVSFWCGSPGPGTYFDPVPALALLQSRPKFWKWTKVWTSFEAFSPSYFVLSTAWNLKKLRTV